MAKKTRLTQDRFVELWQTSESAEEAAERMGITKLRAQQRAADYRKMGVKLKKFKRKQITTIDVARLNKLIDEIDKKMKK